MKIRKTKTMFMLMAMVLVLSVYVTIVYAASTFSTGLRFTKHGKYAVDAPITVRVNGDVSGEGILQYLGATWGRSDENPIGFLWSKNSDDEFSPCEKNRCIKEVTLPGKAGDYKGLMVVPIAWGILDGRVVDAAKMGDSYPIEIEGIALKTITGPGNMKPTVTVTVSKSKIFSGESVKVAAQASSSENDLKSITIKVPSLNKEETKNCGKKEMGSCKFEIKSLTLPDAGDVSIEVTAEDLVGGDTGTSGKSTFTVTVENRVNVVKGLNLIQTDAALKGTNIIDFGGMYQCLSPEIGVLTSTGHDFAWKRGSLSYEVASNDVAIAIYCATTSQESLYDPYFYYGDI